MKSSFTLTNTTDNQVNFYIAPSDSELLINGYPGFSGTIDPNSTITLTASSENFTRSHAAKIYVNEKASFQNFFCLSVPEIAKEVKGSLSDLEPGTFIKLECLGKGRFLFFFPLIYKFD